MARRDYVKKGKKKKEKKTKFFSFIKYIIYLVIFITVAYLFYFLTKNSETRKIINNQISKSEVNTNATLPSKPEERFTYAKELEKQNEKDKIIFDKKIIIETQPLAKKIETTKESKPIKEKEITDLNNDAKWFLQCGVFKTYSNAEILRAKLILHGLTAFIQKEDLNKVLVGSYQTREEAESTNSVLIENSITNCIVLKK